MKRLSESEIQAQAVRWFNNEYCLKHHNPRCQIFSVPNEIAMMLRGILQETRLPEQKIDQIIAVLSQRMKNMGLRRGASDTVVVIPGKTLFVEFKTETGYQSEKQKEFQAAVESCNQSYYVVRSLEGFQRIIHDNMDKEGLK